ncbi:MAG: bi-domain-containing oxidoreductase [Burkholderiaceae bacterium]|nr:bi-domain-containing oxidoreductase [Burkholderiaceae bacterium]
MKQVLQHLKDGATEVAEVPAPRAGRGQLLIRTRRTLVSAGTERMLVEFGKGNLLDKALQQPDKVRMVLDKVRTDGLWPTLAAVRNKLDQPLPMGYCNVGEVVELGEAVRGFVVGERVASNGRHADLVAVPVNLCARVPAGVDDDAAAFTVLGAIALQGTRLAQPTLGEAVVVVGLGLIGLVTVQLLRAQGCRVLGIDRDASRLELARRFGAETVDLARGVDPVAAVVAFSRERGADAVLITASTKSNDPVHQAAQMCRKRGRIVLVGTAGLELSRADFYEKELTFQVSCSYGPGRYDPDYEEHGHDYPVGFVRWTEQRNFEAVLDMLAERRLDVAPLVTHRFEIAHAERAYEVVAGSEPSLGIMLQYQSAQAQVARTVELASGAAAPAAGTATALRTSFVGAGNYAGAVLIPAFKSAGAHLATVSSSGGASGVHLGRKFGFAQATTDNGALLADARTDVVVVCTRHNTHAELVLSALAAGKHVFVEKPLALTHADLARVESAARGVPGQRLMVGFNRRFAPQVQQIKRLLDTAPGPKALIMTINAGAIPADHWIQDPAIGGGRLVGEACHFIDLVRFLVAAPIASVRVDRMHMATRDTATIHLAFADGSIATIAYLSNGSKAFPKERLEVFAAGRVLQLDNFRRLAGFGWPGFSSMNLWRQDKGQLACVRAFVQAVRSGAPTPIPLDELIEVSRVSIDAQEMAR